MVTLTYLPAIIDLGAMLDSLIEKATIDVRPSDRMLKFYNAVGRLPLHLGTALMALTSGDSRKVIWYAGVQERTDAALQVIYDYQPRPVDIWQLSYNCRSVRARGKFVQGAVRSFLKELRGSEAWPKLVAVSLGSGSATQFLRAVAENGFGPGEVKVILVDRDPRAIRAAEENAKAINLEVEARLETLGQFLDDWKGEIHLVEMVGLADYFADHQLTRYFRGIFKALVPGGIFLGANISSDEEKDFAHGAACWPFMHYRPATELEELLEQTGFDALWTGKCGLYTVWAAKT